MRETGLLGVASFILYFYSAILFAQEECEDPEAPEKVRIYFGNGMNTTKEAGKIGRDQLRLTVGDTADRDWGVIVNSDEFILRQLLQVAGQKGLEARDTWYYIDHPEIEPNPLAQDLAEAYRASANIQYFLDHELRDHVSTYLNDLNSGKKVVVVAHSQGNFYANAAYEYIKNNYSDYRNSIGLVGVGTPASRVQDGGDYYQNSEDKIINLVRKIDSAVLAPNFSYTQPRQQGSLLPPINHSFEDVYLAYVGTSIRSSVENTISRLDQPNKKLECENPDDVEVTLGPVNITNITTSSAKALSLVVSGKDITVWTKHTKGSSPLPCFFDASRYSETGPFNTGGTASKTLENLDEDTTYYVRKCAKGTQNRISDTGVVTFTTESVAPVVETRDPTLVSSSGFTAVTGVLQGSDVTVSTYWDTNPSSLERACVNGKRFWCTSSQPKVDAGGIYFWRFKNNYIYTNDYGVRHTLNMSNTYYVVGCGCKNGIVSSGVVKRVN